LPWVKPVAKSEIFNEGLWRGFGMKPPAKKAIRGCPGQKQRGALGNFCSFSIKIIHLSVYTNILAKTVILKITHQFKAFEKQSKRIK